MNVVTAGVHDAWHLRGERKTRGFLDRKRVDVTAEGDHGRVSITSRDPCNNAGRRDALDVDDTNFTKSDGETIRCCMFAKGQLRMPVNGPTQIDEPVLKLG
jgi:hypothetical protein